MHYIVLNMLSLSKKLFSMMKPNIIGIIPLCEVKVINHIASNYIVINMDKYTIEEEVLMYQVKKNSIINIVIDIE